MTTVTTIKRRQLARRVQKGFAKTMTTIGQTIDSDYQRNRVITPADMRVASNRAVTETHALERDADVLGMEMEDIARRLALGLGEEEDLFARLDELNAELASLRRRQRYWSIAAKVLADERGIIRDPSGHILR